MKTPTQQAAEIVDACLDARDVIKTSHRMKLVGKFAERISDYEQILDDHRRLTREIDVLLNGEDGAAKAPALVDIVAQLSDDRFELCRLLKSRRSGASGGHRTTRK